MMIHILSVAAKVGEGKFQSLVKIRYSRGFKNSVKI